jgi:seryl-tRNA synthetase
MIDIRFLRENPDTVRENIRKKFQDAKLPLVDEVIALDEELRQNKKRADDLRANRNKISKSIGALMGQKKFEEAEEAKKLVAEQAEELAKCELSRPSLRKRLKI